MTRSKDAWDVARETDYATSIPIDVADAAIRYGNQAHEPLQRICTMAPVNGNAIDEDETYTVYRVKDHGAVMYHDRGPLALPIGRVKEVVDAVVEETGYIVTDFFDDAYYDPERGSAGRTEQGRPPRPPRLHRLRRRGHDRLPALLSERGLSGVASVPR